jgi:hypothetical protein
VAASTDALTFTDAVARLHPDPFRSITRETLEHAAEHATAAELAGSRADAICTLMRLGALLGERNGHSGIFPLDRHAEPLRFYPVRLFEFDDGVFVVSAADPALPGAEVLSIGGVPIAALAKRVEALVSRDNDWTVKARRPGYLVAAEVLHGLGVGESNRQVFVLRQRGGEPFDVTLEATSAADYAASLDADRRLPVRPGIPYLARRDERSWVEQLDGGGIILVGYNLTRGETSSLADEIAASAARNPPVGVILDLRHNGGGDNSTYGPLLSELRRQAETARIVVLTSRFTFSAAMQLIVDLEGATNAIFVGEPTGGSPNQFGDAVEIALPASGLLAHVATVCWETAGAGDARATREPDVAVPLCSADVFEGRDPVVAAARAALAGAY